MPVCRIQKNSAERLSRKTIKNAFRATKLVGRFCSSSNFLIILQRTIIAVALFYFKGFKSTSNSEVQWAPPSFNLFAKISQTFKLKPLTWMILAEHILSITQASILTRFASNDFQCARLFDNVESTWIIQRISKNDRQRPIDFPYSPLSQSFIRKFLTSWTNLVDTRLVTRSSRILHREKSLINGQCLVSETEL